MDMHLRYPAYDYLRHFAVTSQPVACSITGCLLSPLNQAYNALHNQQIDCTLERLIGRPDAMPPSSRWTSVLAHTDASMHADKILFRCTDSAGLRAPGASVAGLLWRKEALEGELDSMQVPGVRALSVVTDNIPGTPFNGHTINLLCDHGVITRAGLAFHLAWLLANGNGQSFAPFDLKFIRLLSVHRLKNTSQWFIEWAYPSV